MAIAIGILVILALIVVIIIAGAVQWSRTMNKALDALSKRK